MWQDVRLLNATANTLFGLLVLAIIGSGMWWVMHRPMFALREVRLEGPEGTALKHVSPSTVRATALPRIKGNFFTADLEQVRVAFESVPWVRRAAVRREWPNKLVVAIDEHRPLGTWGDDGRLISQDGDLFTANLDEAEEDGRLPEFFGPRGSEREVVGRFRDFIDWLAPVQLKPESVQLSGRYAWTVKLSNGMTVELGREQTRETLKNRVERLVRVYPQLVARLPGQIEYVDMRYPNGLALKADGLKLAPETKKK
ncbi:cell division protein FtsQ/DivIB [Noviherbaspirillum pedocola]|uniref:Cell division protein FtsQ n=1 Tax=Noviherbaspirillum pedocola TaxID=2801341 RepID=A0A934SN69_9BURK|nr:cell division protein FtsQ/DivIB [Noviherbaspirillum pedocola]MBK4733545.1 cell division protein FtsQ/DivIB [Noviherbaspirillum pedocola]